MADKTNSQLSEDIKLERLKDEFTLKLECFELEKAIMQNDIEKLKLKLELVEKEKQLALHKKNSSLQDQMTEIERLKSELCKCQVLVTREMKKTDRPTHFLAIKITSLDMLESLKAKQEEIRLIIKYLPKKHRKRGRPVNWERALVPHKKFHITLNMLWLPTKESIESAKRILKDFDRRKLDDLFGPIKGVEIRGLDTFDKQVLFAKVQHPTPLENLFTYLREIFKEYLMENDDKSLKAHVTIMKSSRVNKLRNLAPVITLALRDKNIKRVTGYQPFEKLQLCSLLEKEDENGYYFVEEEIPLTIETQNTSNNDVVSHTLSVDKSKRRVEDKDEADIDVSFDVSGCEDVLKEEVVSTNANPSKNYFGVLKDVGASEDAVSDSIPTTINKEIASLNIREVSNVSGRECENSSDNSATLKFTDDLNSKVVSTGETETSADESNEKLAENSKRFDRTAKLVEPDSLIKLESNESEKEHEQEHKKNKIGINKGEKQIRQQQSREILNVIAATEEHILQSDSVADLCHIKIMTNPPKRTSDSSEMAVGCDKASISNDLKEEVQTPDRKDMEQRKGRRKKRRRLKKKNISAPKTKYCPITGIKILAS